MRRVCKYLVLVVLMSVFSIKSWAWGRRGHSLICETASYLAASSAKGPSTASFLKIHSFDLGYYCNIPDFIWKRPATYQKERPNHYMNLEVYQEKFGKEVFENKAPFNLARKDFNKKYKDFPETNGRSWWRIQDIDKRLMEIGNKLKSKKLTKKDRHQLQAQWLLLAGVVGHSVGDLAMPLHVSNNYDGQLTNQKGLHHFFEETVVDQLYLQSNFGLQGKVYQEAIKRWPDFYKSNQGKSPLQWAQAISKNSQEAVPSLLALDKKQKREEIVKAAEVMQDFVVERLVLGALYQAMVLAKAEKGIQFNEEKFYNFVESPPFIEP